MELLYIDESGDNGFSKGSSEYFILAGISIESRNWKEYYWKIKNLRSQISQKYGLIFSEIKGTELFTHRGPFFNSLVFSSYDLALIYEWYIQLLCDPMTNLFAIVQSKQQFEMKIKRENPGNLPKMFSIWIWSEFLTLYEKYLLGESQKFNYPQTGLVYFDENPSQKKYVKRIFKKFLIKFDQDAKFPGAGIIENIIFRDSHTSYFIQLADILAYSLYRIFSHKEKNGLLQINGYIRNQLEKKVKMNSL